MRIRFLLLFSIIKDRFTKTPKIAEKTKHVFILMEEREEAEQQKTTLDQTAFTGSLTHTFVDDCPGHYQQQQLFSFQQMDFETLLCLVNKRNTTFDYC